VRPKEGEEALEHLAGTRVVLLVEPVLGLGEVEEGERRSRCDGLGDEGVDAGEDVRDLVLPGAGEKKGILRATGARSCAVERRRSARRPMNFRCHWLGRRSRKG
jgi:hypothetical protein